MGMATPEESASLLAQKSGMRVESRFADFEVNGGDDTFYDFFSDDAQVANGLTYREAKCFADGVAAGQFSFDLRWKADMRAIKRWQEATGRKLTWPDHADLCVWLLNKLEGTDVLPSLPTDAR